MTGAASPYADLFPLLTGAELQDLADDIATHGLLHPITLDDHGQVLDGRNRLAACEIANVEPTFATYTGDDPLGFVISENLRRRHLTVEQRAAIAHRALPEYEKQARERQALSAPGHTLPGKGRAADLAATRYKRRARRIHGREKPPGRSHVARCLKRAIQGMSGSRRIT